MPGYFQQTIIIGAVGRDPEKHDTKSGQMFTTFSVAVTERWRDQNGQGNADNGQYNERTTWYSCSVWDRQAENALNLIRKGQNIMVIGSVSARAYQGGDGQPKASLDLRVQNFKLLGNRGGDGSSGGMGTGGDEYESDYGGQPAYGGGNNVSRDEDIPF